MDGVLVSCWHIIRDVPRGPHRSYKLDYFVYTNKRYKDFLHLSVAPTQPRNLPNHELPTKNMILAVHTLSGGASPAMPLPCHLALHGELKTQVVHLLESNIRCLKAV